MTANAYGDDQVWLESLHVARRENPLEIHRLFFAPMTQSTTTFLNRPIHLWDFNDRR